MFKHLAVALMDYLLVISEFRIFHGLIDLRCFMVFSDANLKGAVGLCFQLSHNVRSWHDLSK